MAEWFPFVWKEKGLILAEFWLGKVNFFQIYTHNFMPESIPDLKEQGHCFNSNQNDSKIMQLPFGATHTYLAYIIMKRGRGGGVSIILSTTS